MRSDGETSMVNRICVGLRKRLRCFLMNGGVERSAAPVDATFERGSLLAEGGLIENCAGGRDRIIVGANSVVRGHLLTYGHGGSVKIGEWCYVGARTEIWSMDTITIGNRVLIAHNVNIHDGSAHSLDAHERHLHFRHIREKGHPRFWTDLPGVSSAPVTIEDDVWISFGATILKGVKIGAGSVIAAGSIVTKDVPPNVLYRCLVNPVITQLPK